MYAVKAIYDGASFKPMQPVDVEGQYEVVITFLEPISAPVKKNPRLLLEPVLGKPVSIGEFDGIIVATALVENMTIITADENIQKYDVSWIW